MSHDVPTGAPPDAGDVEIVSARVEDLTVRLVESAHEVTSLREQLAATQQRLEDARREIDDIRASRAFRLAEQIRRLRNLVRFS